MSHFIVIVTGTEKQSVESQLVPFDENHSVPAYDRECFCIGNVARRDAREQADKELDFDIQKVRDAYWKLPEDERTDAKWKELTKEHSDLVDKLEAAHPLNGKPDPKCDECHGSGTYESQYNPDSKWDWYEVGGRWGGYFQLKAGAESEQVLSAHYSETEDDVLKRQQENKSDVAKVMDIDFETMGDKIVPFAILHNGHWYERGSMGWWGMVSDEKDEDEWKTKVMELLKGLDPEVELSAVDCHI